jgi:TPP-dependent indolepyruvate ferredoxin oxidoreductase alpha subunit
VLDRTLRELNLQGFEGEDDAEATELVKSLKLPVRRPTLCPGCPHRAAFFAIRKSRPKAIFTSDIGCYTLGMNLGVVDTCLDMGAAMGGVSASVMGTGAWGMGAAAPALLGPRINSINLSAGTLMFSP